MSIRRSIQRLSESTWPPLVALLLVGLLAGAWLGGDYGMSWDEERNYTVGSDALQAILDPHRYRDYLAHGEPLAHHGPSYFMVVDLGSTNGTRVNGVRILEAMLEPNDRLVIGGTTLRLDRATPAPGPPTTSSSPPTWTAW